MTMMMMMQGVEAGENKVRRGYCGGSDGGGRKGLGWGRRVEGWDGCTTPSLRARLESVDGF